MLLLRVLTTFIIFKDWVFVFFIFAPWLGRDAAVVIQGQPSPTPVLLPGVTVRQLSHTLLERTDVFGKGGVSWETLLWTLCGKVSLGCTGFIGGLLLPGRGWLLDQSE